MHIQYPASLQALLDEECLQHTQEIFSLAPIAPKWHSRLPFLIYMTVLQFYMKLDIKLIN